MQSDQYRQLPVDAAVEGYVREAFAREADESRPDRPERASAVIATLLQGRYRPFGANPLVDPVRQSLMRHTPTFLECRGTPEHEAIRERMVLDWSVRDLVPRALDLVPALALHAAAFRALPPVTSDRECLTAVESALAGAEAAGQDAAADAVKILPRRVHPKQYDGRHTAKRLAEEAARDLLEVVPRLIVNTPGKVAVAAAQKAAWNPLWRAAWDAAWDAANPVAIAAHSIEMDAVREAVGYDSSDPGEVSWTRFYAFSDALLRSTPRAAGETARPMVRPAADAVREAESDAVRDARAAAGAAARAAVQDPGKATNWTKSYAAKDSLSEYVKQSVRDAGEGASWSALFAAKYAVRKVEEDAARDAVQRRLESFVAETISSLQALVERLIDVTDGAETATPT